MKRRTECKNGRTLVRWRDRRTSCTVIQTVDSDGNQIGDAEYIGGGRAYADSVHRALICENGGEATSEIEALRSAVDAFLVEWRNALSANYGDTPLASVANLAALAERLRRKEGK